MTSPTPAEPTVTIHRPDGTVHILQPLSAIRLGDVFRSDGGPIPVYGAGRYRCVWHRDESPPTAESERHGTALVMLVEPLPPTDE